MNRRNFLTGAGAAPLMWAAQEGAEPGQQCAQLDDASAQASPMACGHNAIHIRKAVVV